MTNFPLSRYRCYVRSEGILQDYVTKCLKQSLSLYITEWNVLAPGGVWTSELARLHFESLFPFPALRFCLLQTLGDFLLWLPASQSCSCSHYLCLF